MPNIAKLIASNFSKFGKDLGVTKATLIKVTPGTRNPAAVSAGTNPTTTSHAATGLVTSFDASEIDGTLIKKTDRKVLLFGASIAGGAVPEPGDRVTIGGETLTIPADTPVSGDPVRATYTMAGRK